MDARPDPPPAPPRWIVEPADGRRVRIYRQRPRHWRARQDRLLAGREWLGGPDCREVRARLFGWLTARQWRGAALFLVRLRYCWEDDERLIFQEWQLQVVRGEHLQVLASGD